MLDRDLTVLTPSVASATDHFEIPDEFYEVTKDDVRRQAAEKSRVAAKELTLRTQAMRDADRDARRRHYRYAMVRLRLPSGHVLQGLFRKTECVSDVAEFLSGALVEPGTPFTLFRHPGAHKLEDFTETIDAAGLVPACVINVSFGDSPPPGIRPELLASAKCS